ncbi:jg26652 [Pararge aegeria aegeria]|uniref:Jg26652 protein n=1 Tax=Pararge aegeria aegeria TaxID=348720 RepID=A0A8S4R2G9_9NEOP|nr:jg26652 [Pararge aegeria aegeria]
MEKPKKQRGRGEKQRASEKFQHTATNKAVNAAREAAQKRLGVFNLDAEQLEKSIQSIMISVQPRAIQLPVATRGVGFTTVAEYSRMTSTWNPETVNAICSI